MDFSKHSDGTTSVKVHHAPGGKSNFSLGWDGPKEVPKKSANQPTSQPTAQVPASNQSQASSGVATPANNQ